MLQAKHKVNSVALVAAVLLLLACATGAAARYVGAGLTLLLVPLTLALTPRRAARSLRTREILLLAGVFGVLFVALTELTGAFLGFYKNPYFVNAKTLLTAVLPISLLIVGSELVRARLVTQKSHVASVAAFVACVAAEVLAFGSLSGLTTLNRFMDLLGMTLLPAVTGGVLYHYVAKRYGAAPNIVYRVLTTLYIYFIPNTTALSEALVACAKILLPIGILVLLIALYEKQQKSPRGRGSKLISHIVTLVLLLVTVATAMLVSCQFRFGALVIATDSMTGEINKGDMIIYERYDGEPLAVGEVIVFQRNSIKVVHRVIEVNCVEGEYRYVTKGDANDVQDAGYVTEKDIVGKTDVKLAGIGFPALWLNEIMENGRKEVT